MGVFYSNVIFKKKKEWNSQPSMMKDFIVISGDALGAFFGVWITEWISMSARFSGTYQHRYT